VCVLILVQDASFSESFYGLKRMKVRSSVKVYSVFSEENVYSKSNLSGIRQGDRYKALFSIVVWPYLKSKLDKMHLITSETPEPDNVCSFFENACIYLFVAFVLFEVDSIIFHQILSFI
jgi:hypothetical protein